MAKRTKFKKKIKCNKNRENKQYVSNSEVMTFGRTCPPITTLTYYLVSIFILICAADTSHIAHTFCAQLKISFKSHLF